MEYLRQLLRDLWNLPIRLRQIYVDIQQIRMTLHHLRQRVGEMTQTHTDIHFYDAHQVIVVGRFNGRDFVKAYTIDSDGNLHTLIDMLNKYERNSRVGHMDMPAGLNFSALYRKERF